MTELLRPMLAVASEPFDSDEHVFEVKWDGVRALAATCDGIWCVWGRDGSLYTNRYPELAILSELPADTIIDGEIVRLDAAGRPVLAAILSRHGLSHPPAIEHAARRHPVTYVVFSFEKAAVL